MPTVRTRRLTAASMILAASLGLSACGTGGGAATNQQYQPGIGANLRTGDVQLYNALLVAGSDDTLAFSAGVLNTTDSPQTLESVTITPLGGSGSVTADPATDVELAPRQLFTIGRAGELAGIDGATLPVGRYADVTLTFSDAGEVEISVPVVARNASYADVAETPPSDTAEQQATEEAAEAEETPAG
ncbi:MAG: hypothetical protein EON53_05115 [Actinomycetales bacterium]|nr:MAG: hypothetical protein EON53_05115 [Actinomycetales bacterium]